MVPVWCRDEIQQFFAVFFLKEVVENDHTTGAAFALALRVNDLGSINLDVHGHFHVTWVPITRSAHVSVEVGPNAHNEN